MSSLRLFVHLCTFRFLYSFAACPRQPATFLQSIRDPLAAILLPRVASFTLELDKTSVFVPFRFVHA
jgi:hypothetical protein